MNVERTTEKGTFNVLDGLRGAWGSFTSLDEAPKEPRKSIEGAEKRRVDFLRALRVLRG